MVASAPRILLLSSVVVVLSPLTAAPFYDWASALAWNLAPSWLHHLAAIVLHLLCIGLAWDVMARLAPARAVWIGVALFALHPAQVEPLAATEGLAPLAASLAALAAWRLWLDGRLWPSAAAGALAGLIHPCAAGLALVLACLEWGSTRRRETLAPLGVMFAFPAILLALKGQFDFDYFAYQGVALLRALWVFMVPIGLAPVPGVHAAPLAAAMAWGVIAVIALLTIRGIKDVREGFWLLAALLFALPEFTFVAGQDLASGRRFYLPLFACAALAGLLLQNAHRAVLAVVGLLFLAITVSQVSMWRDETAVWMESARFSPNELRPRLELAKRLAPIQAVELLEDTAAIWPDRAQAHSALGLAYQRAGRRQEAVRSIESALKLAPCDSAIRHTALAVGAQPPACRPTSPAR